MKGPVFYGVDWRASAEQSVRRRVARQAIGAEHCVTRFRRGFAWVVVGLLVFTLVATLLLEGAA